MSYTTVKAIWPGEKHESLQELRNSHGSAPVVWGALAKRYLGIEKSYDHPNLGWMQCIERVWELWKRTDIPEAHRSVLMLTFDRAYVTKPNYARMARDIRRFVDDFPQEVEKSNHWPALAVLFESDLDVPAIGLHCTSVSEDPFCGPWNEEKEGYDPIDWSTAYDLYADLNFLRIHKASEDH